jgi:hypothetical protein
VWQRAASERRDLKLIPAPILVSSSLVHPAICALLSGYIIAVDHDLDRFAVVHRPASLGNLVEPDDTVEDPPGLASCREGRRNHP